MRPTRFVLAALLVCLAAPAVAQEWIDYVNRDDRFTVNAPGQPEVREITWPSEYGMTFPGRVYSFRRGQERYTITVIDYTDAERKWAALTHPPSFQQAIYWQIDIMASIQFAATKLYRQRPGAKVTYDAWHYINLVEGHQLNLTNPDGTRTFASIYLHENRLYILDGTVPESGPEPGLFTQSLGFLDAEGNNVRYQQIYSNRLPPITLGGRGGRGGGGAVGAAVRARESRGKPREPVNNALYRCLSTGGHGGRLASADIFRNVLSTFLERGDPLLPRPMARSAMIASRRRTTLN